MVRSIFLATCCLTVYLTMTIAVPNDKTTGTTIDKLECIPTRSLCIDVICKLNRTQPDPLKVSFTAGCTLTKTINKITVRIKSYFQTSKKQYTSGFVDTEMDFCTIGNNTNHPLMKTFLPNVKELSTFLHPCPYSGLFLIDNLSIEGSLFQSFVRKRYKTELTFQRGKYQPILVLKFYGELGYKV